MAMELASLGGGHRRPWPRHQLRQVDESAPIAQLQVPIPSDPDPSLAVLERAPHGQPADPIRQTSPSMPSWKGFPGRVPCKFRCVS